MCGGVAAAHTTKTFTIEIGSEYFGGYRENKSPARKTMQYWFTWQGFLDACRGIAFTWLNQT